MTSKSPRIYTYKITFEEVPYYYYGSKKEKYYNQEYWGSPKTNKWCWELYTPKKQILELFDYTDEGYEECRKVENRLIKPVLNDFWCLNESCNLSTSLKICKENGKKTYQQKIGLHKYNKEQRIEISKRGGKTAGNKNKKDSRGIFGLTEEQRKQNAILGGKIAGNLTKKNEIGIFGLTEEQRKQNAILGGKKQGNINKELKKGICGLTKEQRVDNGKKGIKNTNSQKWMCLETQYISTSAGLTHYQKYRGIDTSKRKRVG
jgi:hypothetical protein